MPDIEPREADLLNQKSVWREEAQRPSQQRAFGYPVDGEKTAPGRHELTDECHYLTDNAINQPIMPLINRARPLMTDQCH